MYLTTTLPSQKISNFSTALISLLKPAHLTPRAKHIRYELDETLDERFELQSRSSVVLSDLAHVDAPSIAEHGGIPPLVDLLQLDVS